MPLRGGATTPSSIVTRVLGGSAWVASRGESSDLAPTATRGRVILDVASRACRKRGCDDRETSAERVGAESLDSPRDATHEEPLSLVRARASSVARRGLRRAASRAIWRRPPPAVASFLMWRRARTVRADVTSAKRRRNVSAPNRSTRRATQPTPSHRESVRVRASSVARRGLRRALGRAIRRRPPPAAVGLTGRVATARTALGERHLRRDEPRGRRRTAAQRGRRNAVEARRVGTAPRRMRATSRRRARRVRVDRSVTPRAPSTRRRGLLPRAHLLRAAAARLIIVVAHHRRRQQQATPPRRSETSWCAVPHDLHCRERADTHRTRSRSW